MSERQTCENVVLVIVDALRADRVGALGSTKGLTPNIDSLADNGVVFESAFSCINATDPSLTSIHTGRHPRSTVLHHADLVTDEEKQRIQSVQYLPELLFESGIRTIATGRSMGRWHRRGFESYPSSPLESKEAALSKRLNAIHPELQHIAATLYYGLKRTFTSKTVAEDSTTAIERLLRQVGHSRFYGLVHLMDTHAWYEADEELVDDLVASNDYPEGDLDEFFNEFSDSPVVSNVLEPNVTAADYKRGLPRLFARYDASVRQADQKIGNLIEGLKEREMWDETSLFVLSDHGESLDEHGIYFDHHGLYDETVHVPVVSHVPGGKSDRIEDFVQLHDLAPTILDLLDIDGLDEAEGRSLIGYLYDDSDRPVGRDSVYFEEAHAQRRRAVRTREYKYIEHVEDEVLEQSWDGDSFRCRYCDRKHGDRVELFDLSSDPSEIDNIANKNEDTVADMRTLCDQFEATHSVVSANGPRKVYEDEEAVLERLEDLGYR